MQQRTRYGTTAHYSEVMQEPDAYPQDGRMAGWRDKRGSPVEPQAIGMAWVLACRSVGSRAAPCILTNAIKGIFGTMCAFDRWEASP